MGHSIYFAESPCLRNTRMTVYSWVRIWTKVRQLRVPCAYPQGYPGNLSVALCERHKMTHSRKQCQLPHLPAISVSIHRLDIHVGQLQLVAQTKIWGKCFAGDMPLTNTMETINIIREPFVSVCLSVCLSVCVAIFLRDGQRDLRQTFRGSSVSTGECFRLTKNKQTNKQKNELVYKNK